MNAFRIINRKYSLIILLILILGLPEIIFAQENGEKRQKRYLSPAEINPLEININNFVAEEILTIKIAAKLSYEKGNYLEAARSYLYLVNRNVDDCESYFMIACCYANLQKDDRAIDFLIMAINAGYSNYRNISAEPAFELLKNNPLIKSRFQEITEFGKRWGETRYFEVVKLQRCQLFLPDNFEPQKEYSLVIGLHGNGGNAMNFSDLWPILKSHNIIYVVPESPYNYSDNGGSLTQQYTWSIISRERELWEIADPHITKYISEIAKSIQSDYNITQTLLLGFSQGAGFAYACGIRYNNIFDGLICFGGRIAPVEDYPWFLSEEELINNNDVKIYIAHGVNDQAIGSSEGRASYRKLKKLGYHTHFNLFEGGHVVSAEILSEAMHWMNKE